MKENIKIGLLAAIFLVLGYMAFIKKETPPRVIAQEKQAAAQTSQQGQPINLTKEIKPDEGLPPVPAEKATQVTFEKTTHNFGKTKVGKKNQVIFKFKNTGDKPLIISDAKGSCSCTVPSKPEAPIPPGGNGEITVEFTAKEGQTGQVNQVVRVTANTNPPETLLNINATVE